MSAKLVSLYGIPNCGTVKKARDWLLSNEIASTFHDFKKEGLNAATVENWLRNIPLESLLNRKGTTWRKLDLARQQSASERGAAIALLLEQPSLVKRPVLTLPDGHSYVGFSDVQYHQIFKI